MQRSASDPSLLVATYEGQHNHHPSTAEVAAAVQPSPAANLDSKICSRIIQNDAGGSEIQQILVEEMASSLTRNQSFTAALVAAITGRILDDGSEENEETNSRVFSSE